MTSVKRGSMFQQARNNPEGTDPYSVDEEIAEHSNDRRSNSLNRTANVYGGSPSLRVDFSPTASYMREVMRFRAKHASLKDKVAYFNESQIYWERDKFLKAAHGPDKHSPTTREGRKLKIAEYYQKMKPKL
jgi:hypothetical protein